MDSEDFLSGQALSPTTTDITGAPDVHQEEDQASQLSQVAAANAIAAEHTFRKSESLWSFCTLSNTHRLLSGGAHQRGDEHQPCADG